MPRESLKNQHADLCSQKRAAFSDRNCAIYAVYRFSAAILVYFGESGTLLRAEMAHGATAGAAFSAAKNKILAARNQTLAEKNLFSAARNRITAARGAFFRAARIPEGQRKTTEIRAAEVVKTATIAVCHSVTHTTSCATREPPPPPLALPLHDERLSD